MTKEFRAAARLCVFNDNNELLIVRMNNYWWIPWWGIDYWENISDCLNRESIEELWVKAIFGKVLFLQDYLWDVKWEDKHCLEYFCSVENNSDFEWVETTYTNATHSDELKDVKFCSLDELPQKFMPKWLDEVLKKYVINKENFSCEYLAWL